MFPPGQRLWLELVARRAAAMLWTILLVAFGASVTGGAVGQETGATSDESGPPFDLEPLLEKLGEKARAYEMVALRFVCIESSRSSDSPGKTKLHDYMYVEAEEQRYRPYRQKHAGRPGRRVAEAELEIDFPDSFSWTLMFSRARQHLLRFTYVRQEWFSLRLAHVLEFKPSLPHTDGKTIYQWGGRVWVDAENFNFLKVEAEPGNQEERLKLQLNAYRQAPRFLGFPMVRKPIGASYSITFLNEYKNLSFPDQVDYRKFTVGLDGHQELAGFQALRYAGYQFFDVDVLDAFLK